MHSTYSPDCRTSIKALVEDAIKKNLSGIAVTDHDTLEGSKAAAAYVKKHKLPLKIVLGQELKTDKGELLALFLHKELKSRELLAAIEEVRMQNGLLILPHPYRNKPEILEYVELFDFVEVHNSRTYKAQNEKALALAEKFNLKQIIGSDAHFLRELGKNVVVFESLRNIKIQLLGGEYELEISERKPVEIFLTRNSTAYVKGGIVYLCRKCLGKLLRVAFGKQ